MRRVFLPARGIESFTVIGPDLRPVELIDEYLAWLTDCERSPNTVEAYAHDLRAFWTFLAERGLSWDQVGVLELGEFAAWARRPAENVVVLADEAARVSARTVNRMLSGVVGFYELQARRGSTLAKDLIVKTRSGRGGYKPFLHGIARSRPRGRAVRLPERRSLPSTLSLEQVAAVIDCQGRLRDRFLFALLASTGMRIGQALGLRHEDVVAWERRIVIRAREDAPRRARSKGGAEGGVPVPAELMRLWNDYMHEEYRDLDSDFVFVNLWGGADRAAADLQDGRQDRRAHAAAGRLSLHGAPATAHLRDAGLSRRGGARGDRRAADAPLTSLCVDLHPPDRRGSARRAGRARRAGEGGGSGLMGAEPLHVLQGGGAPRGWEKLWAKDVWGQTELPHGDLASMYRGEEFIRFERIAQPWLKEAAKRWARMRLLSDTSPRTMSAYLVGVTHFSQWLAEHAPEVSMPAALSRAVLEDYMLWVRHESPWKPATRNQRLLAVRLLLEEQREDGLAGLPAGAVIHAAELPRIGYQLPKALPGEVFAQWIDPANLALLDERDRTLVLVLAWTGFRVSSVVTLMRDCVEVGSDGQPYLRYFNVKGSREAMLPIPPLLAEQLGRQQAWLAERFPDTEWLFPSRLHRGAKRGAFHINPSTVRLVIERYVRRAEIRTAEGKLALDVHPHLFRHHLGTSMVNENIPLTVIQDVLDHGSVEMTARYARMRDETVRQAVRRWHERVNIRGERIALPVDGPLEQAAWMKERIARAKQALPNGYCGLPLVQSCPHPNACLSCESFLTDGSFRAVHDQQQAETRRLLEKARKQGSVRLIEILERDEQSLSRILEGLDQIEAGHAEEAAARSSTCASSPRPIRARAR